MPNWAYSKVTLSGDHDTVFVIKEKLATPYITPWAGEPDWNGNPAPAEQIEGVFLLWNIVKPDNLYTYLEKDKKAFAKIVEADPDLVEVDKADKKETWDTGNIMAEILHQQATGQGWYEWNCRNWGTKWEIADKAVLEYELPNDTGVEIGYRMESAWSPPAEALNHLAEQYPDISIGLVSIDESDCFAMSAFWINGELLGEQDEEITHEIGMDLRGYCNLGCCNEYEQAQIQRHTQRSGNKTTKQGYYSLIYTTSQTNYYEE